jgi:hypothetical protein
MVKAQGKGLYGRLDFWFSMLALNLPPCMMTHHTAARSNRYPDVHFAPPFSSRIHSGLARGFILLLRTPSPRPTPFTEFAVDQPIYLSTAGNQIVSHASTHASSPIPSHPIPSQPSPCPIRVVLGPGVRPRPTRSPAGIVRGQTVVAANRCSSATVARQCAPTAPGPS